MRLIEKYFGGIKIIKRLINPIIDEYYPSKANRETLSLYNVMAIRNLAYLHFDGVIKHAYNANRRFVYAKIEDSEHIHFIDDLNIFPKIRYNKLIERLNRYEGYCIGF